MTELKTTDEKYQLIIRNLQEVVGSEKKIKAILEKRPLRLYWGTAPTGKIHIGYYVQLMKIADYLSAGCDVTILIADIHAYLDNMKSSLEQLESRTKYYTIMIQEILKNLGVDISKLKFTKGSNHQLSKEYTMDVYKLHSLISINEAKHGGAEVVKQSNNPKMTNLLYPGLQTLDEHYLNVDGECSGIDQRKIFMMAKKFMPKLGYKKRLYFMTPMLSGLRFEKQEPKQELISNLDKTDKLKQELIANLDKTNDSDEIEAIVKDFLKIQKKNKNDKLTSGIINKMSASVLDSKIDILDSKKHISKKIGKAYCLPGDANDNSVLELLENIVFPLLKMKGLDFIVKRNKEHGGDKIYEKFCEVQDDFQKQNLHPNDLKQNLVNAICLFVSPIREAFNKPELKDLMILAYGTDKEIRRLKR